MCAVASGGELGGHKINCWLEKRGGGQTLSGGRMGKDVWWIPHERGSEKPVKIEDGFGATRNSSWNMPAPSHSQLKPGGRRSAREGRTTTRMSRRREERSKKKPYRVQRVVLLILRRALRRQAPSKKREEDRMNEKIEQGSPKRIETKPRIERRATRKKASPFNACETKKGRQSRPQEKKAKTTEAGCNLIQCRLC